MLNCVYHPIDAMRVVDDAERERLLASGFWYDSPDEARVAREMVEDSIKDEAKPKKGRPKQKDIKL